MWDRTPPEASRETYHSYNLIWVRVTFQNSDDVWHYLVCWCDALRGTRKILPLALAIIGNSLKWLQTFRIGCLGYGVNSSISPVKGEGRGAIPLDLLGPPFLWDDQLHTTHHAERLASSRSYPEPLCNLENDDD